MSRSLGSVPFKEKFNFAVVKALGIEGSKAKFLGFHIQAGVKEGMPVWSGPTISNLLEPRGPLSHSIQLLD